MFIPYPFIQFVWNHSLSLIPLILMWFAVGKGVNVEGAVPSEQEVNQPKPAKRARTSFTADQLQVNTQILIINS